MKDKAHKDAEFDEDFLDRVIQDVVRNAKHRYLESGSSAKQSPKSAKNTIELFLNRHNK